MIHVDALLFVRFICTLLARNEANVFIQNRYSTACHLVKEFRYYLGFALGSALFGAATFSRSPNSTRSEHGCLDPQPISGVKPGSRFVPIQHRFMPIVIFMHRFRNTRLLDS